MNSEYDDDVDPESADLPDGSEESDTLFEIEPDWKQSWKGMPSYEQEDLEPWQTVKVHFTSPKDRADFAKLVGQPLHAGTKFLWYPKAEIRYAADKRWHVEEGVEVNPRYPVYVPTKGRWESAQTIKALEKINVPYYAVVQPQELHHYKPVVKKGEILVLPAGLDGLVPTRNWIRQHSEGLGAKRHWQIDDNIKAFARFTGNLKVDVTTGIIFRAIEDYSDRFTNVAVSGPNYYMFAPTKTGAGITPITMNTRVYSCSLINNEQPHWWRDVYNDDTDLCLRALKDDWCVLLFNAFLCFKSVTMKVKGGNTDIYLGAEKVVADWEEHCRTCTACKVDESPLICDVGRTILHADGRWKMADSLLRQHPDVTTVIRKWNRWQHQVDYRRFRKNALVPRPDLGEIPEQDEYGMKLVPTPEGFRKTATPRGPGAKAAMAKAAPARKEPEQEAPQVDVALKRTALALALSGGKSAQLDPPPSEQAVHQPASAAYEAPAIEVQPPVPDAPSAGPEPAVVPAEEQAEQPEERVQPEPEARVSFSSSGRAQSMADLLGGGRGYEEPHQDFVPDQPPDLSGIDHVVLNFATDGLEWYNGNRPVGVTVSTLDGEMTRFLPFAFQGGGGNLDEEVVKRWAQRELRDKKITNARTKFDVHHAREWGVDLEAQGCTFSDIQHTAALLDDHRRQFGLDILCKDYFPGEPYFERVDESKHAEYHPAEVAPREVFTAQLVGRLHAVMYPELAAQDLMRIQQLEDDVLPAVIEMEKNGAPIDLELLDLFSREQERLYGEVIMEVAQQAGFAFSHSRSDWKKLFEKLKLADMESYDEAALSEVDHPLVKRAYFASQLASLNSKTFKAYRERLAGGNILRFELNQLRNDDAGTVSGRFSAGLIQQVPNAGNHFATFGDRLFPRKLFIPGPGGRYYAADAEQEEYRLFAHYAENPEVLEAYHKDPRLSFHKMTWEMMKRYKPDMLYGHQKNYNFAKLYGAGSIKLATMMKFITEEEGAEIRRNKAWNDPRLDTIHAIEAAYKKMLPEGDILLKRAADLAETRGYVKTYLGRRSRFPHKSKTYIGLNRVIQGTGADVMKRKLYELHRERKHTGLLMRMTVHDEITGDAQLPETEARCDEVLNFQSYPFKVPILWSGKTGANWAECK